MTATSIDKKVMKIIEKETGLKSNEINPHMDFRDHMNLDSMQFVAIAARVEKEFKVDLPISVININTLNEFIKLLKKQLKHNTLKNTP